MFNKFGKKLHQYSEEILSFYSSEKQLTQGAEQLMEELCLYQSELEIQNKDLITAQIDLQKYSDLYHYSPIPFFILNEAGLIVDVNEAGLELLGMKRHLLINRCFSRYIAPEHQALFSDFRKCTEIDKKIKTYDVKLVRWSGPIFDARVYANVFHQKYSEEKFIFFNVLDTSIGKEAERLLYLQQIKMAKVDKTRSMNEQVYAIANSQNHSLSVIDNYIYGCVRRLEMKNYSPEELVETLKKVATQTRELANIILQMKNFSSKTIFRYEICSISKVISEVQPLIYHESLEFPVVVQYENVSDFPIIKIDKTHIQHVILNLVRNAIEAMRDGNTINPKLLIEVHLVADDLLAVSILDNGPGFLEEHAHKLFDAHFTTKSYAVGLGLTTSRSIIEKHGGQLTAKNNAAGGAAFQFTLPTLGEKHNTVNKSTSFFYGEN